MELSVISPTYNEAENVGRFVEAVCAALEGSNYEILIVDDDSPDLTWRLAEEIGKENPRLRVVRRTSQRGLGHAVLQGFSQARGKLVACIDADLQHDPSILSQMVLELRKGCDVAVGSRYVLGGGVHKWSWVRRLMSWIATKAAQVCIRVKLSDPMSGYFMLRREDFLAIREQLNPGGFKILLEILAKLKPQGIVEIPYTFRPRSAGRSKLSTKVAFEYARQLARLSRLNSALSVRFLKFGLVGVLGIAVNLISMALVISFLRYRDWRASALATFLAMLHNYVLNNVWTFRDRKHTGIGFLRGCLLYVATCSIGLLLTTGVYSGLTATLAKLVHQGEKTAGLPASALLFSQFVGVLFGAVSNFLLNETITWRSSGKRVERPGAHSLPGTREPAAPATSWAKTEEILGAGNGNRGLRPVSTVRIDG